MKGTLNSGAPGMVNKHGKIEPTVRADRSTRSVHSREAKDPLQAAGNQAVQQAMRGGLIHRKAAVGCMSGSLEGNADRVAAQIVDSGMATGDPASRVSGMKARRASPEVLSTLGPGRPLESQARAFFEPRLGRDLRDVRIHTGEEAANAACSISARAFTSGGDIVFSSGQYDPSSTEGRRLIAHELAHVQQQTPIGETAGGHRNEGTRVRATGGPIVQRQPEQSGPAAKPPLFAEWFSINAGPILEAVENEGIPLQNALYLIMQAYQEQSPGRPGAVAAMKKHNLTLNQQPSQAEYEELVASGVCTRGVPCEVEPGVTIENIHQDLGGGKRGGSLHYTYDSPGRSISHALKLIRTRRQHKRIDDALRDPSVTPAEIAAAYDKRSWAEDDYGTGMVFGRGGNPALLGQVKRQLAAWVDYRVGQLPDEIGESQDRISELNDSLERLEEREAQIKAMQKQLSGVYDGSAELRDIQRQKASIRNRLMAHLAGLERKKAGLDRLIRFRATV